MRACAACCVTRWGGAAFGWAGKDAMRLVGIRVKKKGIAVIIWVFFFFFCCANFTASTFCV